MKTYMFEVNETDKNVIQEMLPEAVSVDKPLSPETVSDYSDAEIIAPFISSRISRDIIAALPNLKMITTRSTGYDHIDLAAAKERNIVVCNVPEYGSRTVAEFAFGLLLSLTRKIHFGIAQSQSCVFNTSVLQGMDLYGKTIGIIGLGKIGSEVAKIAHGFGMNVIVYTEFQHQHQELVDKLNITYVALDELLSKSDVISLHLPFTAETKHILNAEKLAICKKGCYLINTARGGLIDTESLIKELEKGTFAGIGLDVIEEEKETTDEMSIFTAPEVHDVNFKTMCIDHVLMHHPKVIVTPHNAFNTAEALGRIMQTTISNIKDFEAGSPKNTVS